MLKVMLAILSRFVKAIRNSFHFEGRQGTREPQRGRLKGLWVEPGVPEQAQS